MNNSRVVVLNGDYSFLNTVSWKRAIILLINGKTEVIKYTDNVIKCVDGSIIKIPAVMRLIKIIRMIYRNRVPYSKRNVMTRDEYTCAYCGTNKQLTIDHIVPASQGGKTSFENCVTACQTCNHKKGSRTPREANMYLTKKAYAPTISAFFRIKMKQLGVDIYLKEIGVY